MSISAWRPFGTALTRRSLTWALAHFPNSSRWCCSIIGIVYVYLPFMVLPLYATLERVDRSYLEASLDLGAGQLRTMASIVLPLAKPGIISGIILVFIPALGMFLIPDLLGGPDSQMIGNVIERQFKAANNWPLGAAMSFILLYLTFGALALRSYLGRDDV